MSQFEEDWATHSVAAWFAVVYVLQTVTAWATNPYPTSCLYTFTAAYGISYGPIGRPGYILSVVIHCDLVSSSRLGATK